jgi:hypothetical protein
MAGLGGQRSFDDLVNGTRIRAGIVRPNAFAIFRLDHQLEGSSAARPADRRASASFRILSTK